jgi:sulfur carrier protein ThiS
MDAFNIFERPLCRRGHVGQRGESLFVIALHHRPVFGQRFAQAMKRRHVRVGHVMHELPHRPSAFAVRAVHLLGVEVAQRLAQLLRHLGQRDDGIAAVFRRDVVRRRKFADGITRIVRLTHDAIDCRTPQPNRRPLYSCIRGRMRVHTLIAVAVVLLGCGCKQSTAPAQGLSPQPVMSPIAPPTNSSAPCNGFDRNDYPGDAAMQSLRASFAFTGYWLTNPPGERSNSWFGKRETLKQQGWGFLVLANGRLDKEILKAKKSGTTPAQLGRQDAAAAIAAAHSEGFPAHTILFLDQEEGGRLLEEQSAYLLAWIEAVAASAFAPGLYASGQPVPDGPGKTITTVDDVRALVQQNHLHSIAMFGYQDACPPAPGCTLAAKPLDSSGEPDLIAWQYAQSPRRTALTKSCAATYAADNNCYAPSAPHVFLDMDAAASADPSRGR